MKEKERVDSTDDVKPDVELLNNETAPGAGWIHYNTNSKVKKEKTTYDPLCRNPLYAGGEFCAYTELIYLKNHFHPSVSLFATNILNGEYVKVFVSNVNSMFF